MKSNKYIIRSHLDTTVTTEGAIVLGEALKTNSTLTSLDLESMFIFQVETSEVELTDEGMKGFMKGLKRNISLLKLKFPNHNNTEISTKYQKISCKHLKYLTR